MFCAGNLCTLVRNSLGFFHLTMIICSAAEIIRLHRVAVNMIRYIITDRLESG